VRRFQPLDSAAFMVDGETQTGPGGLETCNQFLKVAVRSNIIMDKKHRTHMAMPDVSGQPDGGGRSGTRSGKPDHQQGRDVGGEGG
jgi:hypothetical protein